MNDAAVTIVDPPAGALGGTPTDVKSGLAGPPVNPPEPAAGDPPAPPPPPSPPAPVAGDPPPKPAAPKAGDPPPPAAPPARAATAADAARKPGEPEKVLIQADWPADWRQKLAGDNKALAKRLERMASPNDLLTSYRALEQRLSSGQLKPVLPTHYTPEELAEYRKANNIPEKPEGYDVNIGNGIVWGAADKPMIDSWTSFAHEHHLPPEQVKMGLAWYAREQESAVDRMAQADGLHVQQGGDRLRATWGAEYSPNLNALGNLYAAAPQIEIQGSDGKTAKVDMWDVVMGARDQSGRALGNIPEFMDWQARLSKAMNPYATQVPDAGGDPAKSVEARYDELSRLSGDKTGPYWRGPNAASMQEEQRNLIDHMMRMGLMDERGKRIRPKAA